jgi:hypothetical protein
MKELQNEAPGLEALPARRKPASLRKPERRNEAFSHMLWLGNIADQSGRYGHALLPSPSG